MSSLVADHFKRMTDKRLITLDRLAQQAAHSAGLRCGPAALNSLERRTGHLQFRHSADTLALTASTRGTPS